MYWLNLLKFDCSSHGVDGMDTIVALFVLNYLNLFPPSVIDSQLFSFIKKSKMNVTINKKPIQYSRPSHNKSKSFKLFKFNN